jgi:5-methylcytosine-specific restriction protein A
MYLRANPLCVDPFDLHGDEPVPAQHVDHILPKNDGGTDEWENLQALCHSCHSKKTVRETHD